MLHTAFISLTLATGALSHTAAWANGMYCRGGPDPSQDNQNTNDAVNPLTDLEFVDWWFQHDRGCDLVPPKEGEFLELPANGKFTVELAHNRGQTTLSYDGKYTSAWPDGKDHPDDWNVWDPATPNVCLDDGALHTYNETSAGGTAFAISYESELSKVTMENLVVFTTLQHTPWKRLATYEVPDLSACPEKGCHCAWLWVPNGCGISNMYMQGFKCKVTNATSTTPLAKAQAPTYCEGDESKCVSGAKQMIAWHQKSGNNIETEGWITPNYNMKCGWKNGAQTDIFETAVPAPSSSATLGASSATRATPATTFATVVTHSSFPVLSPSAVVQTSKKPCTRRPPRASARAAIAAGSGNAAASYFV